MTEEAQIFSTLPFTYALIWSKNWLFGRFFHKLIGHPDPAADFLCGRTIASYFEMKNARFTKGQCRPIVHFFAKRRFSLKTN
jgi:hypothetical protein